MKIRVIGGSHAGIACAVRAKEEYPDSQIVLYEKQSSIGFVAQSIPLFLSGEKDFLKMSSYTTTQELEKMDIFVRTDTVVKRVDTQKKELHFVGKDNIEEVDVYDKLILATGSYPSLPLVEGDFQDKVYVIKNFKDAVRVKKLMRECKTMIIIGGGAIGTEIARIMNEFNIHTTLLQSSDYLLNRYLDKEVSEEIQDSLEAEGLDIRTSSIVTRIEEEELLINGQTRKQTHVYTRDGKQYTAHGVVYATGFRPNSFLVANQVELGDRGAILVDDYMQTTAPDVFAVGDCATTKITNVSEPLYVPHGSDAIRQGEMAAVNLVAPKRKMSFSQGTYKLNFDRENTLCMSGLSKTRALANGFDAEMAFVRGDYLNSDKYYEMWLVYEKETHKILGMQCKGTAPEISAQADLISLAIQQELTVEDLEFTDFYFKHGYRNPRSFSKLVADKVRQQEKVID